MRNLSIADKCKVIAAWILVKMKRLQYEDFNQQELNEYLVDYFPYALDVPVPVGNAVLTIVQGDVCLNTETHRIELHLQNDFNVEVLANPIYRTHVNAKLSAEINYDDTVKTLFFNKIRLDSLQWINDDYTLISDTRQLLNSITPASLFGGIANPLKNIINTVTGGFSDSALNYLRSFTNANKQHLLDEHKATIEKAILAEINKQPLYYQMQDNIWREYLFRQRGTHVSIADQRLRFWLS